MSTIHLPIDFFQWRKTRDLVRLLGEGAELLPLRLWTHCGEYPEDQGLIAENLVHRVEPGILWRGPRGVAIEALKETLFLIAIGQDLQVVDWKVIGGHILINRVRAVKAANQRWTHAPSNAPSIAPSITRGIGRERPGFHRFPSDGPLGPQVNVNTVRKGAQNV